MANSYVADSSALVALVNRNDTHHRWIVAQAERLPWPWFMCEPALTEAFFLVGPRGTPFIQELLRRGGIKLSFNLAREIEPVLALMDKYADVPMSLADACQVRMSEIFAAPLVITTDSDFRYYRRHSRQMIPCLMPSSR